MQDVGTKETLAHVLEEDILGRPGFVLGKILLGRVEHLFEHLRDGQVVVTGSFGVLIVETTARTVSSEVERVPDGFVEDNGVRSLHERSLESGRA